MTARFAFPAAVAILTFSGAFAAAEPPRGGTWELVFGDEFDGKTPELDARWEFQNGPSGHILCSRWRENVVLEDGRCRLLNKKQERGGQAWTSGSMWTKQRFRYGYFEARYKYAAATGLNNSFWIMTRLAKEAPGRFEIDINEGHFPNKVNMNVHRWSGEHVAKPRAWKAERLDLAKDFHVYGLEWNEKELAWFFDGHEIRREPNEHCHVAAPVWLSSAVMKWAGEVADAIDGTSMDVDYVRVYQRKGDASAATTKPAAGAAEPASQKPFSAYGSFDEMAKATDAVLPPVRAVTRGPKFHWFGYYDKFQLDPSDRYLLCMEVGFEHRLPEPDEAVTVGMVDLADGDRWIELGKSRAWSWQQGCMLQWRPGSDREALWNDREGDRFVCRILDVKTRAVRTLPMPIEHVSPDGKLAVCADFSRIWNIRAGYGYAGVPDRYADQNAPAELGVWRMDLETGQTRKLLSIADLVKIPYENPLPNHKHYVNHLAWSPNGKRFLLFHRWVGSGGQPTRVFTLGADGADLRLLSARGASHWTWRDPENVLIWGEGSYRLYKDDGTGEPKETLWTAPNGHQTYLPGTEDQWLVTDTYPYGPKREQIVYLFHLPSRKYVPLGRFVSTYKGEWRCDSHPRVSRDGKRVIIDSPHGDNGRQQYVIDIARILAEWPKPERR